MVSLNCRTLANPDAKEALIVAFGMGSSYRSALIAGLDVEAVELVPSVVDMFGYYYPDAASFEAHPNGRIVVADGRNHLELSGKDYDIIVDGSDNFETRYLVNDACYLAGKPNVHGSIFQFEGMVTVRTGLPTMFNPRYEILSRLEEQ